MPPMPPEGVEGTGMPNTYAPVRLPPWLRPCLIYKRIDKTGSHPQHGVIATLSGECSDTATCGVSLNKCH